MNQGDAADPSLLLLCSSIKLPTTAISFMACLRAAGDRGRFGFVMSYKGGNEISEGLCASMCVGVLS